MMSLPPPPCPIISHLSLGTPSFTDTLYIVLYLVALSNGKGFTIVKIERAFYVSLRLSCFQWARLAANPDGVKYLQAPIRWLLYV